MMSIDDDKAFEDQIERMKQKNQYILDKFQACEEDRKQAENHGATIKKDQNITIRLKTEEIPKLRNNKSTIPRPKSFHSKNNYEDQSQNHISYNQFNDNRKQGKYKNNNKSNDDAVAYQDYMHFQQTYINKTFNNNYKKPIQRQHSNPNYMDDNQTQKPMFNEFNRFGNQSMRNRNAPRFAQNTYQNNKNSKENEIQTANNFNIKVSKENDLHMPNHGKMQKENDYHNYRNNSVSSNNKEPFQKQHNHHNHHNNNNNINYNNTNNQQYKKRQKPKVKSNDIVDGAGDSKTNSKKKSSLFDDEYIDDTLEDLEQYRLKVDMEDFIVIDPESPNPILAMPLKPWTNHDIMTDIDGNKSDNECKLNESSSNHLLNNANERAKEYLNLVNQNNIDHTSNIEISAELNHDENIQDNCVLQKDEVKEVIEEKKENDIDINKIMNTELSNNNSSVKTENPESSDNISIIEKELSEQNIKNIGIDITTENVSVENKECNSVDLPVKIAENKSDKEDESIEKIKETDKDSST